MYKLPDHEFTAPLAEAATAAVTAAAAAAAEAEAVEELTIERSTTSDRPSPHNSCTVVGFCGKHCVGAKSIECSSSSSSSSDSIIKERASSQIEDKSDNTRKRLDCCSDAVGETRLISPPQQRRQQQQQLVGGVSASDDVVIPRKRFKWVSEDAGEPGPQHVAVKGECWGGAVRSVRFRLTDVWLSCEQVYLSIYMNYNIEFVPLYVMHWGGHLFQGPLLPGSPFWVSPHLPPPLKVVSLRRLYPSTPSLLLRVHT